MNAADAGLVDATELAAGDAKRWLDVLTRQEIRELRQMNDWRSWLSGCGSVSVMREALGSGPDAFFAPDCNAGR